MKRPPKGEAALRHAATPKLTGLTNDTSGQSNAQGCAHHATRTELLLQGHQHYARLTCALCGRHLHWVSRDELLERQKTTLSRLWMCPELFDWERALVREASRGRRFNGETGGNH